jgi:hypothetical protein
MALLAARPHRYACMKKSPVALLLAAGLILGSSAAAAANLTQHPSVSDPNAPVACGFDGEQEGQFEDPACDINEPEMNDANESKGAEGKDGDKNESGNDAKSGTDTQSGEQNEQTGNNQTQEGEQAGDNVNDQN